MLSKSTSSEPYKARLSNPETHMIGCIHPFLGSRCNDVRQPARARQGGSLSSGPALQVIFATNIAETALTIPGVRYVVDTGVVKQRSYQAGAGVDLLAVVPVSKAQARQRSGRAGWAADTCLLQYLPSWKVAWTCPRLSSQCSILWMPEKSRPAFSCRHPLSAAILRPTVAWITWLPLHVSGGHLMQSLVPV